MNNRIGWLAGGAAAAFVFLASHASSRPHVLWRYSYSYFAFLVTYLLIAMVAIYVAQRPRRQRHLRDE